MKPSERTVIVCSGIDWVDASFNDLVVPLEMDLEAEKILWQKWYDEEYFPNLRSKEKILPYKSFVDLLLEKGARKAEIEQYWDL